MSMKINMLKTLFIATLVAVVSISCKDRDAEKKIAQLESRLAGLGGKKSPTATPTPPATQRAPAPSPATPAAK